MKKSVENLRGEIDAGLNGQSDQVAVDVVASRFSKTQADPGDRRTPGGGK